MIDNNIENLKSIKYYVKRYLDSIKSHLKNKVVIDIPAGNGATTEILKDIGAQVEPFDLFPEYFLPKNIECKRADINVKIPVNDNYADMLICQEGIEHFSDQIKVFKEFNRVLKDKGHLLLTTPSYSNLSAKFSYLLFESESNQKMPPNEIDDIWMSNKSITNETYYGHIFLVGLQKLRVIGKLSGFKINEIKYVRLSKGSLFLFPFFYPFIIIASYTAYLKNIKKDKNLVMSSKKSVYKEQLSININPKNLLNKHIFIIFEKEINASDIDFRNERLIKPFGKIM
jgi:ubiquinone/menaquinone biosynthesis C-methylase UbiE